MFPAPCREWHRLLSSYITLYFAVFVTIPPLPPHAARDRLRALKAPLENYDHAHPVIPAGAETLYPSGERGEITYRARRVALRLLATTASTIHKRLPRWWLVSFPGLWAFRLYWAYYTPRNRTAPPISSQAKC